MDKLKYRAQFIKIKRFGQSYKTPYLILKYLKNSKKIKWAVSASKYAYKKAVDRNFAKRRMRELIRQNPPSIPGNFLMIATNETNSAAFEVLKNDYHKLLTKIYSSANH